MRSRWRWTKRRCQPLGRQQNDCDLCLSNNQVEAAEESSSRDARKAELLSEVHGQLERKHYNGGDQLDGIRVSFRLACGRVDHTFPSTSSVKVRCAGASGVPFIGADLLLQELYQFVMVKARVEGPFTVYKMLPRTPVLFSVIVPSIV